MTACTACPSQTWHDEVEALRRVSFEWYAEGYRHARQGAAPAYHDMGTRSYELLRYREGYADGKAASA